MSEETREHTGRTCKLSDQPPVIEFVKRETGELVTCFCAQHDQQARMYKVGILIAGAARHSIDTGLDPEVEVPRQVEAAIKRPLTAPEHAKVLASVWAV